MNLYTDIIRVNRSARVFASEKWPGNYRSVLFVLHGYGMDAEKFLMKFESLFSPDTLVVSPEGLSRFYHKGFQGDVVASWMTKAARIHEINDYLSYFDLLLEKLSPAKKIPVYVLGFSQGAPAASRWVMQGRHNFKALILWSGQFAPDIPEFSAGPLKIFNVIGYSDEFITMEQFQVQTQYIESKGFDVTPVTFNGGHDIDQATLASIWEQAQSHA